MPDRTEVESYNYSVFVGSENFMDFRTLLPVGSSAPDFEAVLLETARPVQRILEKKRRVDRVRFLYVTVLRAGGAGAGTDGARVRYKRRGVCFSLHPRGAPR
jgi:hypothetical protein